MDSQGFTSDTGWGCMIRSGQSLLANGLSNLFLGRGINHCPPRRENQASQKLLANTHSDWRRGTETEKERRLLSLFADFPGAPFSIHRFVKHGAECCGKYPGEWFGPSATALCIQYGKSLLAMRTLLTCETGLSVSSVKNLKLEYMSPTTILMSTKTNS